MGTAFVRIRAITAALASEIKDGVEKGVKDADVDKAGKAIGDDLGKGATEGLGDTMADGLGDALDAPDVHKASKEGGEQVGKDVSKGIEDEHKRRNPFRSMLDALKRLSFKDAFKGKFDGARDEMRGAFDDVDIELPEIDLDVPGLKRKAEKGGEEIGGSLTDGVEKEHKRRNPFASLGKALDEFSSSKLINWAAIFGPTTLAPIIGTVLAGLALITQALGFIVTAAAGAGAALAGIAGVALPGIAVLFAAFKVQSKQLDNFKKAAKKLLQPWEQIGLAAQEFLLPGLEAFLEAIQQLIPLFADASGAGLSFATQIGKTFGNFAKWAGAILTSEKNMSALGVILEASEAFFENIATAALHFIDLLLPFFAAVAPLAVQFSESIADWAAHLADVVNLKSAFGELDTTFQTWYDRFVLLAGIIGDIVSGLWGILSIGAESGTPFFDKLGEAAQTFSDWVGSTEGENKIKKFFDDAQPVLDEIWRLLGNVFDLIVAPAVQGDGGAVMFSRLAAALDLLNDVLENPVTAKVVPYLLDLAVALALLNAVPGLSTGKLAGALIGVSEGIGKFVLAFAGVEGLSGPAAQLGAALAPFAGVILAVAAAIGVIAAVWIFWDQIEAGLKAAWEWFTKLSPVMRVVVGSLAVLAAVLLITFAPFVGFIAAVVAVVAAIKHWSDILPILKDVGETIATFFTETLPNAIGALPGLLGDFIGSLPAKLAAVGQAIIDFFTPIPGRIKEALLSGLQALPGLILDALGALGDLGMTLLGWIADGIVAAAPVIGEWFIRLPFLILDWVGTAAANIIEIGLNILQWVLSGLVQALPEIAAWFLRLPFEIATLVRRGIAELFTLGVDMIVSLVKGIGGNRDRILDFFHDLPLTIARMLAATVEFLFNFGKGLLTGMLNGIQNVFPKIRSFFAELPGKVVRFLSGAGKALFDIGVKLMNGLWEGINDVWDSIDEFFGELPGKIGGFFKRLPGVVTRALQDFVDTVIGFFVDLVDQLVGHSIVPDLIWDIVEWFAKLPLEIVGALADLVTKVVGIFWDLGVKVVDALPDAFRAMWDWFSGLPQKLFDMFIGGIQVLLDLGGKIVTGILDGLAAGAQALWDWFSELPQKLLDLITGAADLVKDIGGKIIGWIVDGLGGLWSTVTDWIADFPENFALGFDIIKDKVLDIGGTIIGWIVEGFGAAWTAVSDWISDYPENFAASFDLVKDTIMDIGGAIIGWIVDGFGAAFEAGGALVSWVTDLPGNLLDALTGLSQDFVDMGSAILGWIIEGLGTIGTNVKDAILDSVKAGYNAVIDLMPDISIHMDPMGMFGPSINFDWDPADHLKWKTMGGIIPGSALGTVIGVGEGNRSEAVVPMTRPARALAVMQEAGLDKLVLDAYMDGAVPAGRAAVGDTTLLRIDHAVMTAPVDADMIVQKITSAYSRLAS